VYTLIKEFRVREGITQADLAQKAGVRRETIVFLEKGKYNPSLRLAHHIACILHTSIEELFFFDDETEPEITHNRSES
jgi:putative transcriptional regulator